MALIHKPRPELAEQETQQLRTSVYGPIRRLLDGDASVKPDVDPTNVMATWNNPAELVPWLRRDVQDGQAKGNYLHLLVSKLSDNVEHPDLFVVTRPYFFWRPPDEVYRRAIASWHGDPPLTDRLFQALPGILREHLSLGVLVREGHDDLGLDAPLASATLHRIVRFVFNGVADAPTPPTKLMFSLLGEEEWLYRLGRVRRLVQDEEKNT